MQALTSSSGLMLYRSMQFLWTKQACLLDNIANVETPGYKTKYVTFEEALDSAIRRADTAGASAGGMKQAIAGAPVQVHEAQESTKLDDNGVNITEQSLELARTGYQLQYVLDTISSDFSTLRTAIRG